MFLTILQQVAKLFLFLLAGYLLTKKKILDGSAPAALSKLLVWVFVPALTLSSFCGNFTPATLASSSSLLLAGTLSLLAFYLLGRLFGKAVSRDVYTQNVCAYSVCIPNYGYIGSVLVLAILGKAALVKYQILTVPLGIFIYTEGYRMLAGEKGSLKALLNPMMTAMALGILLGLTQLRLPETVLDLFSSAAACVGPVSMILTGCVIAQFSLKQVLSDWRSYATVAVRMVLVPFLLIGFGRLVPISKELMGYLIALYSMPTGLNTVVFPSAAGKDCSLGAGMACVSSVAAMLTVPFFWGLVF